VISILQKTMGDVWFSELRKAQQLTKSVADALAASERSPSAREAVTHRGKLRQANSVASQLEQSLASLTDQADSARRSALVAELLATIRDLTSRLDGEIDDGRDSISFEDRVRRQDKGLDRLHTSIVGLREVGTEISAEIESQTRLLGDIDGQAGGMDLEQQTLYKKYQTVNSSSASTCTLYFMIVVLIFLLITTIYNF
jgi:Mg-chelatase subunit ChlI